MWWKEKCLDNTHCRMLHGVKNGHSYSMIHNALTWMTIFLCTWDLTIINGWSLLSASWSQCSHQDFWLILTNCLIEKAEEFSNCPDSSVVGRSNPAGTNVRRIDFWQAHHWPTKGTKSGAKCPVAVECDTPWSQVQ
jgi:hypothetical protein